MCGCRRLKKLLPLMLPHAIVYALTTIFEELSQLDESRCVPRRRLHLRRAQALRYPCGFAVGLLLCWLD